MTPAGAVTAGYPRRMPAERNTNGRCSFRILHWSDFGQVIQCSTVASPNCRHLPRTVGRSSPSRPRFLRFDTVDEHRKAEAWCWVAAQSECRLLTQTCQTSLHTGRDMLSVNVTQQLVPKRQIGYLHTAKRIPSQTQPSARQIGLPHLLVKKG